MSQELTELYGIAAHFLPLISNLLSARLGLDSVSYLAGSGSFKMCKIYVVDNLKWALPLPVARYQAVAEWCEKC